MVEEVTGQWTMEMDWIRRARLGETGIYEKLLAPNLADAARLAYGMLQDRSAAEDAVQEAAVRAWQRLDNLQPERSFRPWFLGIVANRCRETRRSRWWLLRRRSDPDAGLQSDEGDWLAGADLRGALAALPPGQRAAIILHFYLDLPLEEVAATLGLGLAGVKSRINRGLRRLRWALEIST